MLRYNTSGSAISKPVDYYRPLTVDVSVEYELPKEVAPPKGSAPLLIIHPSAYFRSKPVNQSPVKQINSGHRTPANQSSRLGDIASTLYYLSTNGQPSQLPSAPQHIKTHRNSSSYGTQTEHSTTRTTRSRTATKILEQQPPAHAQPINCDQYGNRVSQSQQGYGENGRIKKSTQNQAQLSYTHAQSNPPAYAHAQSVASSTNTNHIQIPATRATASNKRLRMMSQQQQNSNPMQIQTQNSVPPTGMLMEPLNLALTPSAPHPSVYNNQFSSFLGYGLHQVQGGRLGSSPNPNTNPYIYANTYAYAQQSISRGLGTKEGPVPVEKGSGSDSGVCSENDSDDISPQMAPFSSHSRRSNLSQEFPTSGCYCCCCPSANTSSSRKGSKASAKATSATPSSTATFSSGLGNYGNLLNVIHQHQQLLGEGSLVEPLGGSPMDSSGPPPHHLHQQRKWLNPSLVPEPASFGKWYQV